jgi:hypothetical protein
MEGHRMNPIRVSARAPLWASAAAGAMAALLLPSCAALPTVRGYYTPAELHRNADALVGQTVSVRGKVEIVAVLCTEEACGGDNPCCNYCSYSLGFSIDEFHNIYFSGEAASCTGDDCHADCPSLQPGGTYEVRGKVWEDLGGIAYLELSDWTLIDPAPAGTMSPPRW